ncbi:hypothetical protein QR680_009366 [Steinernema hermaphroditum]|uniref:Large ribosomal subunit protein uL15m n=1 Tax=Steinernema hermaphroditum TaxID=289476 RepID=A0AA39IMF7_9BILA|nr:hypothetical protein QR680_009366 [Steinernema hermaphroditum]
MVEIVVTCFIFQMQKSLVLLFVGVALSGALKFEPRCGPAPPPANTGPDSALLPNISLPLNYLIDVLYVKNATMGNETAAVHEEVFDGRFILSKLNHTGKYLLLNRANDKIFARDGIYGNVGELPHVFELPDEAVSFFGLKAYRVGELIDAIVENSKQSRFANTSLIFPAELVAGLPAVHWVGCNNSGNTILQVEVAYVDNAVPPPSPKISNPVILSFDVTTYKVIANTTELLSRSSFQVTFIDVAESHSVQEKQKIPRGTHCENMPKSDLPANMPSKFEIKFQYVDTEFKNIDYVETIYDAEHRVGLFTLDLKKDLDLAALGHVVLNKTWDKVDVVHDFTYGFQYVLSPDRSRCYDVAAINGDFGDVKMTSDRKMDLSEAKEFLLGLSESPFYYDGEITGEAGEPLDKYVAKVVDNGQNYSVVEILFTKKGWSVGSAASDVQTLYSVTHFHKNEKNVLWKTTTVKMNEFIDRSTEGTQWTTLNIASCLKFAKNSYFYVKLASCSMAKLASVGFDRVGSTLFETLAKFANVSVLRFAEPHYEQVDSDVYVYFALSEVLGKKPADTVDRKSELPLANVTAAMNATLASKDLTFMVKSGKVQEKFTLAKNAFGFAPSGPAPKPLPPSEPFKGYSGGSMFVLGLFMFLFGAFASVGGLILYWRTSRGRISGNVYQVFEMKSIRSSSEQALKYVEKASRIKISDLRDNPGARVAGRVLKSTMNQAGHTIGELQRAAKPPLGWIWGDFFRPWHRMFPGDDHFNGDINLRREYPPISLLELQRLIDLDYLDTSKLIDLSALCSTKQFKCEPSQRQFGVQLTDEGAGIFKSKVNLEVQWASATAIAAIEKAGGRIRTAYYDLESLRAASDPKTWFQSGQPVPMRKAPPQQLVSYYRNPANRGYLAEPSAIAESEERLAELMGYERHTRTTEFEEKARDQVFLGIPPGSLVSLADRKVFYPTTPAVEEYYKQQLISDHPR